MFVQPASLLPKRPRAPLGLVEGLLRPLPAFVGARTLATGLRMAGVRVGRTSVFWGMPNLAGEGDLTSRLEIGEYCGFNFGCYFELDGDITIEDHVSVGHEVMFLTRTYDPTDPTRRGGERGSKPVRIGAGAWLGARCTIMPGVTVGAGSVVGANVVVREDVPPNILFTGNRKISIAKWR
jgi:maltose O-acetyltransferase